MTEETVQQPPGPSDASTPPAALTAVGAAKPKDWMDGLQAFSAVLVPITVALVGFIASAYLDKRQTEDTKTRFYIDLLSKREDADSALRQNMFNTFIQAFIKPEFKDIPTEVLALELLEANFNESLDLSPLFRKVAKQLESEEGQSAELTARLVRVAQEAKDKQVVALTGAGGLRITMTLDSEAELTAVDSGTVEPVKLKEVDIELPADPVTRTGAIPVHISVFATAVDKKTKQVHVRLSVVTTTDGGSVPVDTYLADGTFWVDLYDLPVLNNTRLTADLRCALVLDRFSSNRPSELSLVIFPAARASTKDKPYLDDMMSRMVGQAKAPGVIAPPSSAPVFPFTK